MIFNGKMVMKLGMRKITKWAQLGFLATWGLMVVVTLLSNGHPPLAVVGVLFFLSFFCSGMLFGNYNAMAMEPMGHIAGMASAVTGFLSSLIAVILGGLAGRLYDGTMYPISFSFLIFGLVAWIWAEWAAKAAAQKTVP